MLVKKLAAAVLSVIFALLLAEGLVRVAGVAPQVGTVERGRFRLSENPRIGYEPVPVAYEGDSLSFYDYRGASNSLGYRDREHTREKPPGTYRIVVLGDSIAAGLEIEKFEDTFPARLEAELRADGRTGDTVEVLSFAVSGYNTEQEVETLRERGLAFSPDLVVVAYCLNDRQRVDGGILESLRAQQKEEGKEVAAAAPSLLLGSALYRLVRYGGLAARANQPAGPEAEPAREEDTVVESFEELARLADAHDFEVLVVIFPRFQNLFRYRWLEEHAYVAHLAHGHGLRYLDLLEPFQACWPGDLEKLATDLWHPTAYGHACAAAAVAEQVEAELSTE